MGPIVWANCDGTSSYKVVVEGNSLVQIYKRRQDGQEVMVGNIFVQDLSDTAVCVKIRLPEVQTVPERVLVTSGGMVTGGKGHKRADKEVTPEHEED